MTTRLGRLEGRLFAEGGCLFLVVHSDEAAGIARVSCRVDGTSQLIEMPFAEVASRVASSTHLILDNLNGPETAKRILERKDGWYFAAREGQMGPFASHEHAAQELARYILSMQTVNETHREPRRSAPVRRRESVRARQPA